MINKVLENGLFLVKSFGVCNMVKNFKIGIDFVNDVIVDGIVNYNFN